MNFTLQWGLLTIYFEKCQWPLGMPALPPLGEDIDTGALVVCPNVYIETLALQKTGPIFRVNWLRWHVCFGVVLSINRELKHATFLGHGRKPESHRR